MDECRPDKKGKGAAYVFIFTFTGIAGYSELAEDISYEKELFQRMALGDESAFKTIFDKYKERFYGAALKMTRSADTAEEIVQEVFVDLWMHRLALNGVANPSSYLFAVVYHHIYAHFRKLALEKRMKQNVGERMKASECATEEMLSYKESQRLLQHIIRQLPPQQELIYKLSKQEGLSRDEIADYLHISPNTVKNHLLKALKYIRAHFKKALFLMASLFF